MFGGPSRNFGICGDAIRLNSESFDNGNKAGCSANCRIDVHIILYFNIVLFP